MQPIPVSLPLISSFGDQADALRAHLTAAAAAGVMPHSFEDRTTTMELPFEDLAADDLLLASRRNGESGGWEMLLGCEQWLLVVSNSGSRVEFLAQAATPQIAEATVEKYMGLLQEPVKAKSDDQVSIEFCHASSRGVQRSRRNVRCPAWAELDGNYPAAAGVALGRLCATSEPASGRLVLMWGAPGTGKTTAVRALAREWAAWCRTSYVLDPETLFGSSEYFHDLALDGQRTLFDDDDEMLEMVRPKPTSQPSWRLLVIEDADEVLRADAKLRSGQALSRLLNLTDGIVGQGMRTLVLVTTNEPVSELHPALIRPGRCLAQIEVGHLGASEAAAWLRREGHEELVAKLPAGGCSLADLYALVNEDAPLSARTESLFAPTGYL